MLKVSYTGVLRDSRVRRKNRQSQTSRINQTMKVALESYNDGGFLIGLVTSA